jgi:hypothetical protein
MTFGKYKWTNACMDLHFAFCLICFLLIAFKGMLAESGVSF